MSQAENSKLSPSSNTRGWFITHKAVLLIIILAAYSYFTNITGDLIISTLAIGVLAVASAVVMAGKVIDLGLPINCIISFTVAKLIVDKFSGDTPDNTLIITGIICGIIGSAVVGLCTGKIITRKYIPPYLGSFAIPCIILYLLFLIFNNSTDSIGEFLALNNLGAIGNNTLYIITAICIIITLLFTLTKFGRNLRASGSSAEAAIEAGINPDCSIIQAYILSGLLAGAGGILLVNIPQTSIGIISFPLLSWLPAVLLGAVIGGNKFSGGKLDIIGAFLGGIITVLLTNIIVDFTGSAVQGTAVILLTMLIIVMATDIKKTR